MDLSVVVPAFNEAERIEANLRTIHQYLSSKGVNFEIIVVDDKSEDNTVQKVKELMREIPRLRLIELEEHQGKGGAVKTGILSAKGNLILMSDADLSCPITELEKLQQAIKNGADLAIGSRRIPGARLIRRQPWLREKIGLAFGYFTGKLIPTGVLDTQCGFKCFKREVAKTLFSLQTSRGFCFDLEILAWAKKLGYRIAEVGVVWEDKPQSKVKPLRHLPQVVWEVFKIRRELFRRREVGRG